MHWRQRHKIIFSDESMFRIDNGGRSFSHVKEGQWQKSKDANCKLQNGGLQVHVWGAITYVHLYDIVILKSPVNVASYEKTLRNTFKNITENAQHIFQQNNAKPYIAKNVTATLKELFNTRVLTWPALSSDLSPIEQLWGIMKPRLYGQRFDSSNGHEDSVLKCYRSILQKEIAHLLDNFLNNIIQCKLNKGDVVTV